MNLDIVEYAPDHLKDLSLQPAQSLLKDCIADPVYWELLGKLGPAYTGIAGDKPVACFGLWTQEWHRSLAWGLVSCEAGRVFPVIHKAVLNFLDTCGVPRVEAAVRADFQPGHRWAKMLGFAVEGLARGYEPDGSDAVMYARVRW